MKEKLSIETRLNHLVSKQNEYEQAERFRQLEYILLAGYYTEIQGKKHLRVPMIIMIIRDSYRDKSKSQSCQKCRHLLRKYRKAKSSLEEIRSEIQHWQKSLNQLDTWLHRLENETNPLIIAKILRKGGTARSKEKPAFPCQYLDFRGWRILIGRSGKENEDILRHFVRGSDLWLHARDYAGSYVFIKAKKTNRSQK